MKRKLGIMLIIGFLVVLPVICAQELPNLTQNIGTLLQNGQIDLARQQLDAYLVNHPDDADAWLMQGNVVLKEQQALNPAGFISTDESIFSRFNGWVEPAPVLIPRDVAVEVAGLWLKAAELDPLRQDIREALAYLYTQALMTPELVTELSNLKTMAPDSPESKYLMCDLAKSLADRRAVTEAIDVYRTIIGFYPEEPGVYAALADTLMEQGRLNEAGSWLQLGAALSNPDKKALCRSQFHFWMVSGNFGKAQEALQTWSKLTRQRDGQFFAGLLLYYNNNAKWVNEMKRFLAAPHDQTDLLQRKVATFLVSPQNKHDYQSYLKTLTYSVDSCFSLLLHKRAVQKFANQVEPYTKYAEFYNTYHLYQEALSVFRGMEEPGKIVIPPTAESFYLQYAWALQNSGDLAGANLKWLKLFNAKDFFYKSAALYFYGKNLAAAGKSAEAIKFFRLGAKEPSQSKYAFYCQQMLQQFETEPVVQP
ncbi:MAG TPA: tetratricopeptide repeat protein [Bacillota bacterium]|nr:tetratricopeptide repeat protein [Bacillota bacterium]